MSPPAPIHAIPSVGQTDRSHLYAAPAEAASRLRVVLVTPVVVPRWLADFIDLATESRHFELLVVFTRAPQLRTKPSLPWDLRAFLAAERLLLRLSLRILGRTDGGPFSPVGIGSHTGGPSIPPQSADDAESLRRRVAELQPDLVLLNGNLDLGGALSASAANGCWVMASDLVDQDHAGITLLAPILEGGKATPFGLELAWPGSTPRALDMTWGATRAESFSQQRDRAFLKLPAMLMRALRQLASGKLPAAPAHAAVLRASPSRQSFAAGSGMLAMGIALKRLSQSRSRKHRARQPWFLLLPESPIPVDPVAPAIGACRSLVAPGKNYWADPFPVIDGQRRLLFVEELIDSKRRGAISCLELQGDGGSVLEHGVVLDEPFHLSYPQVFQWHGRWYMTVESSEAKCVSLYVTDAFPHGWRKTRDLIVGRVCVDPTLYRHENLWYLFCNISESGANSSDELFLFTSAELEGPYSAHPGNPIVSDVRKSRPAGQLFLHDGKLIRPSQCCTPVYGAAIVFNEVTELSPWAYAERPISELYPEWSPLLDGCHTYNRAGDLEVLDVRGQPAGH